VVVAVIACLGFGGIAGNQLWGWFDKEVVNPERISIVVEQDPGVFLSNRPNWDVFQFVFPASATSPPSKPPDGACRDMWKWSRSNGGVDAKQTRVRVYVRGDGVEDVVLDGARVLIDRRIAPAQGALVSCFTGGAEGYPRSLEVDLDADEPTVTYLDDSSSPTRPFVFRFPKGKTETEIFEVMGLASRYDCRWSIELSFLVGEKRVFRRIPDSGFLETTGTTNAQQISWDGRRWRTV
jgi:hypothetical protein